ncbi:hypothetical protein [Halobacillus sp. Marseille-P3879]|uniref:DUF4376 domain-containing protein n=1 Tax=Halobacillus sp. Marseille-P3879 TaxID=2045014 RepID=UPI000C7A8068|nr:hypothetical protein [Halobacillus sp. Marseille-P3879]
MKKIYIEVLEDGRVDGWGTSPSSNNSIEIEVEENHGVLSSPFAYKYENRKLFKDTGGVLKDAKEKKIIELDKACESAILAGFFHVIDGVEYHFSYDLEAQVNFGDLKEVLKEGIVDEVMWTVRKDGEYTRIPVTSEIMSELTVAILMHKQNNISKFRDFLEPQVKDAKTIEEVKEITW